MPVCSSMRFLSLTGMKTGMLGLFALSILATACAAAPSDPESTPSDPVVADEAPVPAASPAPSPAHAAATDHLNAADGVAANDDATPHLPNRAANEEKQAANPAPPPGKVDGCALACAICEQGGNPQECAVCHSEECRK